MPNDINRLQPFGPPDGHNADIKDLREHSFVDFDGNVAQFGGLAISPIDLSGRVFVGKKGAGKTVYLRRAQAFAQDQEELFADDIQQELPTTPQVFAVNRLFPAAVLTQVWMSLWRVAVLRSLYSYLRYEPLLRNAHTDQFARETRRDYGRWLPNQPDAMSVYSQIRAVIRLKALVGVDGTKQGDRRLARELHSYITHEDWDGIERRIANQLAVAKPVCLYLDAVDEEFRHAPMHYLVCQKGLFYQVMRFLRDSRIGPRLHVVISIRDLVYSSVMQTEHLTRYLDPERIRLLEWNLRAITYLLREKVDRLDRSRYLGDRDDANVLRGWLGVADVANRRKAVREPIEQYLLRHTRLIPRDVIILLNMLHVEVVAAGQEGATRLEDEAIWRVVHEAARLFGVEQLAIAGNQLAIGEMPTEAVEGDYVELYSGESSAVDSKDEEALTGIEFDKQARGYVYRGIDTYDGDDPLLVAAGAYQRGIVDDLGELVKSLEVDRISREALLDFVERAEIRFPDGNAASVLWQNGLIGYSDGVVETGEPVFYSAAHADPLELPMDKPAYMLHPCLIDSVGIRGVGAPVNPYGGPRP